MYFCYVDGSCSGNGKTENEGGYAIILCEKLYSGKNRIIKTVSQRVKNTTNNRMEMMAIIEALKMCQDIPDITIYSDSAYCVNMFNDWIHSWKERGWKKSDKSTPLNMDLILEYDKLKNKGHILKVKGHVGIELNELADKLAKGEQVDVRE